MRLGETDEESSVGVVESVVECDILVSLTGIGTGGSCQARFEILKLGRQTIVTLQSMEKKTSEA